MKSLDAVLVGRTNVDLLEIEEETIVADTIAVKASLHIASEVLETFREVGSLLLIVRVSIGQLGVNVLEVLVAVPEVVIGGTSGGQDEGSQGGIASIGESNSPVEEGSSSLINSDVGGVLGVPVLVGWG